MGGQKKLTPKQLKFARLIAEGKSHADALRGSYCCDKMKAATIQKKAYDLLRQSHISTRVEELKKQLDAKHLITREEMLLDMMKIRNVDILDMIDCIDEVEGVEVVKWKDPAKWTKSQRRAVKSIKNSSVGIQIEFHDMTQISDRISKMLGWDAPTKHELKQVDEFDNLSDDDLAKELERLKN